VVSKDLPCPCAQYDLSRKGRGFGDRSCFCALVALCKLVSSTVNLTPEHHPPIAAQLRELAAAIQRMLNPLFLQAFLTIELVLKVIQESTLYHVQRLPALAGIFDFCRFSNECF
jgi:hypothetical protein